MHYLHRILVYIPDVTDKSIETMKKNETLQKIRSYADLETEDFYQQAFDWRETDSAGCWSIEYPINVILAKNDIERFVKELTDVMEIRNDEIHNCLTQLKETVGTNLEDIVCGLQKRKSFSDSKNGLDCMAPYYLYCLAAHLHGDYRCDSYFYNTHEYSSNLFQKDIDQIKEQSENWALVMFDYHN